MPSRSQVATLLAATAALVTISVADRSWAQDDDRWSAQFTPTRYDGAAAGTALLNTLRGYGGRLYAAGNFNQADGQTVGAIAVWDGATWRDVEEGVRGEILASTVFESRLVVGGHFRVTERPRVVDLAAWDGTSWEAIESPAKIRNVQALAANATGLYVSAYFDGHSRVARWDGAEWSFLGPEIGGSPPTCMLARGQYLFVGFQGGYRQIGTQSFSDVGLWNGKNENWSNLDGGVHGSQCDYGCATRVKTILPAAGGETLFVGNFTYVGSSNIQNAIEAHAMATRSGGQWQPFHIQAVWASAMIYDDDNIYWSGHSLDSEYGTFLDTPTEHTLVSDEYSDAMTRFNGDVYMGTRSNGHVLQLDPEVRQVGEGFTTVLGGGLGNRGEAAITAPDGSIIVLGVFTKAGNQILHQMARWDGTRWSAFLASPIFRAGTRVYAATYAGNDLYVGGTMELYPDKSMKVARVRNDALERLDGDVDGTVRALAANGQSVYIGGEFVNAGDQPAEHIVEWRNESWQPLGDGVDNTVLAITSYGNNVVAGGEFTAAGTVGTPHIALWNGAEWSGLGDGFDGVVKTVVHDRNMIFAGGSFTMTGGTEVNHIAVWYKGEWHPLGAGTNGDVIRLAMSDRGWLYAAGDFTQAGGIPANNVAAWDGQQWHALGSGVNADCWGVTTSHGHAYFTGFFLKAGGKLSHYFADWTEAGPPALSLQQASVQTGSDGVELTWELDPALSISGLNLYRSGTGISAWTKVNATLLPPDGGHYVDDEREPGETYVYEIGVVRRDGSEQRMALGQAATAPLAFRLDQNYPNPFNPTTTIVYTVPKRGHVRVEILDVSGRRIRRLVDESQAAGEQHVSWDATNDDGNQVASGIYIYRYTFGDRAVTRKLTVLR